MKIINAIHEITIDQTSYKIQFALSKMEQRNYNLKTMIHRNTLRNWFDKETEGVNGQYENRLGSGI